MGGCCSSGCCAAAPSKMLRVEGPSKSKRPWRHSYQSVGERKTDDFLNREAQSISDASYGKPGYDSGLIIKNRQSFVNSSSEGFARSSSLFVDVSDDEGPAKSALSQLLIQVTENLASNFPKGGIDDVVELRLSPKSLNSLYAELVQLSGHEDRNHLPTLCAMLKRDIAGMPIQTNVRELHMVEGELFAYLMRQSEDDVDSLITLRKCISSLKISARINRLLQLHLRSLMRHPNIQECAVLTSSIHDLLGRLEASTSGLTLSQNDANSLLELITMTNVAIFNPTSTPPAIFGNRELPQLTAALRISETAQKLQIISEDGEIRTAEHRDNLGKAMELLMAASEPSCPSARFYSQLISENEREQLKDLLVELTTASAGHETYAIPEESSKALSERATRLGEVALLGAKFKVAAAHHTVKNRFRLQPISNERVCILQPNDHQSILEALLLIQTAHIPTDSNIGHFKELLQGDRTVELAESDADYLKHVLTQGLDFQLSAEGPVRAPDDALRSSAVENVVEELFVPVEGAVWGNPFAQEPTRVPNEIAHDGVIDDFFQRKEAPEDAYENDSLMRPTEKTVTITSVYPSSGRFDSSATKLFPIQGTLPRKDSNVYFMLLSDVLVLETFITSKRRSAGQFFACKFAPFQIIQLCDCVRKLSSLEPSSEDAKLNKKLSTEANRRLKVKLHVETMNKLRKFFNRMSTPVVQDSQSKLADIEIDLSRIPVEWYPKSIPINAENAFYLAEICSAALFISVDPVSLVFLERIKTEATSGVAINVSVTEFNLLMRLTKQAMEQLQRFDGPPAVSNRGNSCDSTSRLLNLYRLRALLKSSGAPDCEGLFKRLLWRQGLTIFFNYYPEKATKRPFSDLAFNVFIAESDCVPEDLRGQLESELGALISMSEHNTNLPPSAVTNLLHPRINPAKVSDALRCKFVVSSVNSRQLSVDPSTIGYWLSFIGKNPDAQITSVLTSVEIDVMKEFLLTSPQTQEFNEIKQSKDGIHKTGPVDGNLVSLEPTKLLQTISELSGVAQTSIRLQLEYVLLLEALMSQCNHATISIDQKTLNDFQVGPVEDEELVEKAEDAPLGEVPDCGEILDEAQRIEDGISYLHDIITDEKNLISTEQLINAVELLQKLKTDASSAYEGGGMLLEDFESFREDHGLFKTNATNFMHSGSSLLYGIASLRGLRAHLANHRGSTDEYANLIFTLRVCQNYLKPDSSVGMAAKLQDTRLRQALVDGMHFKINFQVLEQIQVILEQKLATDLSIIFSQSIERLGQDDCVGDLELLSTLQFVCIAAIMMPVSVEVNLLAMLLCRPMAEFSPEKIPLVRTILVEMSQNLRLPSNTHEDQIRFLTPLLPLTMDSQDSHHHVEFDQLLTTVSLANCLADGMGGVTNAMLNQLLAKIFWCIFFNHERLTSGGLFGRLYKETANCASAWLAMDSGPGVVTNFNAFFQDFFYVAPRFPLDQTAHLSNIAINKTPEHVKRLFASLELDYFHPGSYFPLLQALLVSETFLKNTSPDVPLTLDQLISLYHAVSVCLHSGYFDGHLDGKVGLINVLNKIEASIEQDKPPIRMRHILFASPEIRNLVQAPFMDIKEAIIKDLRSHIAPVILPMGSEIGNPFTTPDMVLVREGLEASLSGLFVPSPSNATTVVRLMNSVNASSVSISEFAEIWRILNCLFAEDSVRASPTAPFSQLNSSHTISEQAEVALSNINTCLSKGSLKTAEDASVFLKAIFALSTAIRLKSFASDSPVESSAISETFVSSPSESFSSFSVSAPLKETVVAAANCRVDESPCPKVRHPLQDSVVHQGVPIDITSCPTEGLLEAYHFSRLLVQSGRMSRPYASSLAQILKPLAKHLREDVQEQLLSAEQSKMLLQISVECFNILKLRLPKEVQSLSTIQGHFSLALPTSTPLPEAANRLASIRIANVREMMGQSDCSEYAKVNLSADPSEQSNSTFLLALQGAQKALDGFPLNIVEQACLLYASRESGEEILFADVGAAIYWNKYWPPDLSKRQRDFLEKYIKIWRNRLAAIGDKASDANVLYARLIANSGTQAMREIVGSLQRCLPVSEGMARLEEEEIKQDADCADDTVRALLSFKQLDPFVSLQAAKALQLAESLQVIAERAMKDDLDVGVFFNAQNRLYLAVACHVACNCTHEPIELPAAYLNAPDILINLPARPVHTTTTTTTPEVATLTLKRSGSVQTMGERLRRARKMDTGRSILRRRTQFESDFTSFPTTPSTSSSYQSSMDRLHELIEIRRAVVAGSAKELRHLGYEVLRSQVTQLPCQPSRGRRYPDKLDLSLLKRRCEEHTRGLVKRSQFEQKQASLCVETVERNLRLLDTNFNPSKRDS